MSWRAWGHLVAKVGTSKRGGKQWQTTPQNLPRMQRTRDIPVAWLSSGLCPDRPKGWIPIIIIIIPPWCPLEEDLYPFLLHRHREREPNACSLRNVPLSENFDVQCLMFSARAHGPTAHASADWTYLPGKQWAAVSIQLTWITTPPQKCWNWSSSILHFFNDTLAGWLISVGRDGVLTLNNDTKFSLTEGSGKHKS